MNMSIPDFLINDSYDHHFYDNAYANELNSINVLTGEKTHSLSINFKFREKFNEEKVSLVA